MLVVLADDFSGAAEIGGIAWRYGLQAEIQLEFNPQTNADVIVVDTDTRGVSKQQAIEISYSLSKQLKQSDLPIQLFKKVDSVFRGHIIAEINALQKEFNFDKVLLLPANPSRGRKIIEGNYLVNDVLLEQTVFASDPHFPAKTSSIRQILEDESKVLPHTHLSMGSKLPSSALLTADVISKQDLKSYIEQTTGNDLCCGAAESFEAFLEHNGLTVKTEWSKTKFSWPAFTLIISGSTVKAQFDNDLVSELNMPALSLPGQWEKDRFVLEIDNEQRWNKKVLNLLKQHHVVFVHIGQEIKQLQGTGELFSPYFLRLVQSISGELGNQNIHYSITGGATASGIIRNIGNKSLRVKAEIAPGIVTLLNEHTQGLFTVKPGSYKWPLSFVKSLKN